MTKNRLADIMSLSDAKALGRRHGRVIAGSVLAALGVASVADVLELEEREFTVVRRSALGTLRLMARNRGE